MDVPVPQIQEDGVQLVPECVQNLVVEQIGGVPAPQIMKGIVAGVQHEPRERVKNRVVEQIWSEPVPQIMKGVVEMTQRAPHERMHQRVVGQAGCVRQHSGELQTRLEWQTSSKRGTTWNWRRLSMWSRIANWPRSTTQLLAVSNSSSTWASIENTFVGHSGKQERIVLSVKLPAVHWNGHCQQRSNRIEKSEFCCSITSRLTNQTPIATG